jgi:hypothetical protein
MICYKNNGPGSNVAAAALVEDSDNILILGDKTNICIEASEIPTLNRACMGNSVIKDSKVLSVSKV